MFTRYALIALNDEAARSFNFQDEPDEYEEILGGGPVDVSNSEDYTNMETDLDEEGDENPENNEGQLAEGSGAAKDAKGSPKDTTSTADAASDFKPYKFEGKVNGEQVVQEFKSKKEMDITLARGIQAPKIYEAYQTTKAELEKIREDAEWGQTLQSLARENPREFFEHVIEELIPEAEVADWVADKYNEYANLARMPPEQRELVLFKKQAEKAMKEQEAANKAKQAAEAAQEKARAEREKAEFANWRNRELKNWESKLPDSVKANMDDYLRAVAMTAQAHLNAGRSYGLKEMSEHLAKLLQPMVISSNPSQQKREELNNVNNRNAAEKNKLRNMAQENDGRPGNKPKSMDDIWNMAAKKAVSDARNVLKNERK